MTCSPAEHPPPATSPPRPVLLLDAGPGPDWTVLRSALAEAGLPAVAVSLETSGPHGQARQAAEELARVTAAYGGADEGLQVVAHGQAGTAARLALGAARTTAAVDVLVTIGTAASRRAPAGPTRVVAHVAPTCTDPRLVRAVVAELTRPWDSPRPAALRRPVGVAA